MDSENSFLAVMLGHIAGLHDEFPGWDFTKTHFDWKRSVRIEKWLFDRLGRLCPCSSLRG
jgi:hypothetical protein